MFGVIFAGGNNICETVFASRWNIVRSRRPKITSQYDFILVVSKRNMKLHPSFFVAFVSDNTNNGGRFDLDDHFCVFYDYVVN